MPIGGSDGAVYKNNIDYQTASGMPSGSPAEPAGALKSSEGSNTPSRGVVDKLLGIGGPRYELWPERLARSAFTEPHDAMQGQSQDEMIKRANDMAGFAVGGSMPAALAMKAEQGTLGSFAGIRSMTLPKDQLELAQQAEKEGFGSQKIYRSTGFFRGADKKWRYEIDDSQAKLHPENFRDYTQPLSKVLDHPELYKAYPHLKDIGVRVDPYYPAKTSVNHGQYMIFGRDAAQDLGTVLHEVQHSIQDHEGFAKGGAPGKDSRDYALKFDDDINKLRSEWFGMQSDLLKNPAASHTDAFYKRYDYLKQVMDKYNEYAEAGKRKAGENYLRLAGETEARNTETRSGLTPLQRMYTNPTSFPGDLNAYNTEDVSRAGQIVSDKPLLTTPYTDREVGSSGYSSPQSVDILRRAANDNKNVPYIDLTPRK